MDFDTAVHTEGDVGGSFTEQFHTDLPEILGDDFKDADMSEMFKRAGGLSTFIKNSANTKRAYDTKLENVIQRPGAKATDEQKAEFRTGLLKELGVPSDVEGYALSLPDLPEGLTVDTDALDAFGKFCLERNIPTSIAKEIHDLYVNQRIEQHNAQRQAAKEAYDNAVACIKTDWVGDKLPTNLRAAHDALMQFSSDDVEHDGQTVKGLKTLIKEAEMYATPDNFDKWQALGISPDQLRLWSNIGQRMQSGDIRIGDKPGVKKADSGKNFINAVNAKTPDFQVA